MAIYSNNMVAAAVVVAAMLLVASTGVDATECPTGDLVYPYWSMCWNPALYYGREEYELAAASGRGVAGRLAPEWDETNSTYYVRLADVGAKYRFTHMTRELRQAVAQSENLLIQNIDTGRFLGWRQEGEDEWFLVEGEDAVDFQFSIDESVALACPLIYGARCEAYHILNFGVSSGLGSYVEDDVTYFKQSNTSDALAFMLLRTSSTTSSVDIKMATTAL